MLQLLNCVVYICSLGRLGRWCLAKTKEWEIVKKRSLSTPTLPTAVLKCIQMYTTNNANANTHTNTNAHTNILKTHMFKEKQPMWLKLNALQRTFPFIACGWGGMFIAGAYRTKCVGGRCGSFLIRGAACFHRGSLPVATSAPPSLLSSC